VVFETEDGVLLVDGYHRVAAAKLRGAETVTADVRRGSRSDALRVAAELAAVQRGISPGLALARVTLADVTAASMLGPLVAPPESPIALGPPRSGEAAAFYASVRDRQGFQWVAEVYRRHRRPSSEVRELVGVAHDADRLDAPVRDVDGQHAEDGPVGRAQD
jgi:hypothetical protein